MAVVTALIAGCLARKLPDLDQFTRSVDLAVCYEGDFALDLAYVAERCGLTEDEVIHRHASSAHRVLMLGFVPGHPYIGGLDPSLSVLRRATPRSRVSAGSIAIANNQTVIYPFATPGGWNIIGRTPQRLFRPLSRSTYSADTWRPGQVRAD